MYTLKLNGREVHSLAELRESFELEAVMAAFLDGSLGEWLEDCFYEREAEALEGVEQVRSPKTEQAVCGILGVDWVQKGLTPELRADYARKRAILEKYTRDEAILARALETATNQAELAELLNAGAPVIYLCGGNFSIPIRKSGVHYIGVGAPKVETAFTEEQYRRAGITFEGVELPREADPAAANLAREAAVRNGYDDFAERHSPLAAAFHFGMKTQRLSCPCRLNIQTTDVVYASYKSRAAAKKAGRQALNEAYDRANGMLTPGNDACIASELAERYAACLRQGTEGLLNKLQPRCGGDPVLGKLLSDIRDLAGQARERLQADFESELWSSGDYYRMYNREYFLEQIEAEGISGDLNVFDNEILNTLYRLTTDEYMVEGLLDALAELREDLNSHADAFCGEAFQLYTDYCGQIEKLAEEMGEHLSGEDLKRLGILAEERPA